MFWYRPRNWVELIEYTGYGIDYRVWKMAYILRVTIYHLHTVLSFVASNPQNRLCKYLHRYSATANVTAYP